MDRSSSSSSSSSSSISTYDGISYRTSDISPDRDTDHARNCDKDVAGEDVHLLVVAPTVGSIEKRSLGNEHLTTTPAQIRKKKKLAEVEGEDEPDSVINTSHLRSIFWRGVVVWRKGDTCYARCLVCKTAGSLNGVSSTKGNFHGLLPNVINHFKKFNVGETELDEVSEKLLVLGHTLVCSVAKPEKSNANCDAVFKLEKSDRNGNAFISSYCHPPSSMIHLTRDLKRRMGIDWTKYMLKGGFSVNSFSSNNPGSELLNRFFEDHSKYALGKLPTFNFCRRSLRTFVSMIYSEAYNLALNQLANAEGFQVAFDHWTDRCNRHKYGTVVLTFVVPQKVASEDVPSSSSSASASLPSNSYEQASVTLGLKPLQSIGTKSSSESVAI